MNFKKVGKVFKKILQILFKLHDEGLISENHTIPVKKVK